MKKNYVLDTNVLIYDPKAIFKFEDNNLYIPIFVLEEIDNFKTEMTERGRNARAITKSLDILRSNGDLTKGIDLENGGKLTILLPKERRILDLAIKDSMDYAILQTAIDLKENDKELRTIFVSMDMNLRLRAECVGLQVAEYENQRVDPAALKNNVIEMNVDDSDIDFLYSAKRLDLDEEYRENTCFVLKGPQRSALARYTDGFLIPVKPPNKLLNIIPKNVEQKFALDMLLDDDIKLVTVMGIAGSGKTLLSALAGIQQVVKEEKYSRLLISRPVIPLGRDIGFLPGSMQAKMDPWMQPIYDNLDFLLMGGGFKKSYEQLMKEGLIKIEPLTYIRGRSIPNQFILLDEAQNLTPHDLKTVITRCGENTKIVLTGDPYQIDNPYIDSSTNGLSILVEKFHGKRVGHILLTKGERSELATLAAEVL